MKIEPTHNCAVNQQRNHSLRAPNKFKQRYQTQRAKCTQTQTQPYKKDTLFVAQLGGETNFPAPRPRSGVCVQDPESSLALFGGNRICKARMMLHTPRNSDIQKFRHPDTQTPRHQRAPPMQTCAMTSTKNERRSESKTQPRRTCDARPSGGPKAGTADTTKRAAV